MDDDLEPIFDDDLDDADDGIGDREFVNDPAQRPDRLVDRVEVWPVVAVGLAGAAVLIFSASILQTFQFTGLHLSARVFLIAAEGGWWPTALLVLAAAATELLSVRDGQERSRLSQWTRVGCTALSAAILVSAVYALGYIALAHPGTSNDGNIVTSGFITQWSQRLGAACSVVGAAALAALALFIISRTVSTQMKTDRSLTQPAR